MSGCDCGQGGLAVKGSGDVGRGLVRKGSRDASPLVTALRRGRGCGRSCRETGQREPGQVKCAE